MAWRGVVRPGKATQARLGGARRGKARQRRPGEARQGPAWLDVATQARPGNARQGADGNRIAGAVVQSQGSPLGHGCPGGVGAKPTGCNMQLYKHQERGRDLLIKHPRYCLWWDCGVGKTITVLAAIDALRGVKKLGRCLVVAPKVLLSNAWRADANQFCPGLKVASWHDKPRQLFWKADLALINYESFLRNVPELITAQRERKQWQWLICDESSKLKDACGKTSRKMRCFAMDVPRLTMLSGSPAPNDALEYWSQIVCVNPDLLGSNWYKFRLGFGKAQRVYAAGGRPVDNWHADPAKVPGLMARIATVSDRLAKEDCLTLPGQTDQVIRFALADDERRVYDELEEHAIVVLNKESITADNILSEMMKLRQVCGGWIYDAEHQAQAIMGQSKQAALFELLEQIGAHQAIIWIEFVEDAHRLSASLGSRATMLVGGMSAGAQDQAVRDFKTGACQYLIAHPATAGHGLTFVGAKYAIYYGLGFSWELHLQSRERIYRIGQAQPVTYYYLLAENSVEEDIHEALGRKQGQAETAMEWLQKARER